MYLNEGEVLIVSVTMVPIGEIEDMILEISNTLSELEIKLEDAVEKEQERMFQDKREELKVLSSKSEGMSIGIQKVINMETVRSHISYPLKAEYGI